MNIRLSLKLVFFTFMTAFAAAMAYAFFVLSFEFYVQGADDNMAELLIETARDSDLGNRTTIETLGFTITRNWQDIPERFRVRNPEPPTERYQLREFAEFDRPNAGPYEVNYVLMVQEDGGAPIYIAKSLTELGMDMAEPAIGPYDSAILIAVFSAAAFSLLLIWTLRVLVKPLEDLQAWAGALTIDNLEMPAPSFRFREFSSLAEIVRRSLYSVSKALSNEREFLQFASHELRSPLTAMRSNVDLLKLSQADAGAAPNAVLQRIERATLTMTELVQTLLWLSRDDEREIETEGVSLSELTEEVVAELDYLREGKPLDVRVETNAHEVMASRSAVRIALSNLVRNAFQHSEAGTVSIRQTGPAVRITNPHDPQPATRSNDLGFGLGTRLINRLSDRFGWQFESTAEMSEFTAQIVFSD